MKYREVGEIFKKGKHWYKVIESVGSVLRDCTRCDIKKCINNKKMDMYCNKTTRKDNNNVYYKKVKNPENPNKVKQENKDLPCPFCGSNEVLFENHKDDCFLRMQEELEQNSDYYTANQMLKAWNTRVENDKQN